MRKAATREKERTIGYTPSFSKVYEDAYPVTVYCFPTSLRQPACALQPNDFMKLRQKTLEVLRYVVKRRCFSWYTVSAQVIHHFTGQRYAFACVKPVSVNMVLFCTAGRRRYGMCHVGLLCAWIFFFFLYIPTLALNFPAALHLFNVLTCKRHV